MTIDQQTSLLGKVAAYTEILIKDPNSTIFVSLAEIYRKMGLFDDACQILNNGLEKHPDSAPAYIILGRIQCQQGDYALSSSSFEKALELDSESLAALVGYARVKILLEHYDKAREILLRARQLSPADSVINKLILSLPEVEETKEDIEEVSVAEEHISSSPVPLISATIADLHLKQGMHQEALAMYRELQEKDPDNLEIRRKIRELEKSADKNSDPGSSLEAAEPVLSDISDAGNDSINELPEQVLSTDKEEISLKFGATEKPEFDGDSVVAELHRWLVNIAKRRENV